MNTTPTSTEYADQFFQHFAVLRKYAEKVFVEGKRLADDEEEDRLERLHEFLDVGARCDFTQKQLVELLYAELF